MVKKMVVTKIESCELHGSWDGHYPVEKDFIELEKDFENMDIPLRVIWLPNDDGWVIQFIKKGEK